VRILISLDYDSALFVGAGAFPSTAVECAGQPQSPKFEVFESTHPRLGANTGVRPYEKPRHVGAMQVNRPAGRIVGHRTKNTIFMTLRLPWLSVLNRIREI
jgi:hypothetical protein